MSTTLRAFGRRWAIPLAATVPVFAIVFAFSLGPMPHKYVFDFERDDGPVEQRTAGLEAGGDEAWAVLVQEVRRPTFRHREEAMQFLFEHQVPGARVAFERIAESEAEDIAVRKLAQRLLERDPIARSP